MKNLILMTVICLVSLFSSCKKDIPTDDPAQHLAALKACLNDKEFAVVPKQGMYIEGEIDGKYFSISKTDKQYLRNTLTNFLILGYQPSYANTQEAYGNGIAIYPIDTTAKPSDSKFNYYFQVIFPSFQGDSIAYINYFNQFQNGKNFSFRKDFDNKADVLALETIGFSILMTGGCNQDATKASSLHSSGIDQTNSYFRIADVKEYSTNNRVYKREITIEFDVMLGSQNTALTRIKNGRIFFSY
jgi:hypothetical protein